MPADTDTVGNNVQRSLLRFRIHTVTECLFDTGARLTDEVIAHSRLARDIYIALQGQDFRTNDLPGFDPAKDPEELIINKVNRVQFTPDHRFRNFIVTIQSFTSNVSDYSGMPEYEKFEGLVAKFVKSVQGG
jgi:hypothetical protein